MATINPYLNFMGKTEEAFRFYQAAFGGEFLDMNRFGEMPDGDKLPKADQEKIMHVSLPIGKNGILMGSDALESQGHSITMGNNCQIAIGADSKEEADHLFNKLSAGGEIEMPIEDTFWGAYFGMFADRFGIRWIINYDYPKQD